MATVSFIRSAGRSVPDRHHEFAGCAAYSADALRVVALVGYSTSAVSSPATSPSLQQSIYAILLVAYCILLIDSREPISDQSAYIVMEWLPAAVLTIQVIRPLAAVWWLIVAGLFPVTLLAAGRVAANPSIIFGVSHSERILWMGLLSVWIALLIAMPEVNLSKTERSAEQRPANPDPDEAN